MGVDMKGMIKNADHVLSQAIDPATPGIPRNLFKACKGIVLIQNVKAGFIFTGNLGAGVLIKRNDDGTWSNPSAMGMAGMGGGFVAGAQVADILVLIMDNSTLDTFAGTAEIKFGGAVTATAGPVGRELDLAVHAGDGGYGGALSYTFTKGVFGGAALEGAVMAGRPAENAAFYGIPTKDASPKIIIDGAVEVTPKDPASIQELHQKLEKLYNAEVADGSTTQKTTEKVTKADGTVEVTVTTINPDGSKTIEKTVEMKE